MLKEFKEFALKGNVMDLAIGVIIGAAFSGIVKSMVDDVIMPIIGAITGGVDFSNFFVGLASNVDATTLDAAKEQGAVLAYGNFITATVNFLIIAFVLFMAVRAINSMKRKEEAKPAPVATKPPEVEVLEEIRDLLAKK
ncbi:large conductance mechanosensitive channel protein MscL [Pararhizobium sp. IMCC21322]|uniref:large conductance mechanosensitive channel protein MscL n=1 Tax=Pararhizobium sp. IMCC21322 TaxID=3067903 RepID=UPI0027419B22|nr:large conductance mechanosensitive channel protein MscL [Pararhizobium sp. IMCC21322]